MFSFARRGSASTNNSNVLVAVCMRDDQHPLALDTPTVMKRCSEAEWSGSGYVSAKGSPNTVAASWNEIRCFRRFRLACPNPTQNSQAHLTAPKRQGAISPRVSASALTTIPRPGRKERFDQSVQFLHALRLTELPNPRQLLPTTPLPPVSFERYYSIIILDSNRNPWYPVA
jgi:hypothetical protein